MLTIAMAASALVSVQGREGRGPPPPPPVLYDHRGAYFLRPPASTLTTEWACPGSARPSMARIAIRDYRDDQRRQMFRVSLVALRVNGAPVERRVFEMVANALAPLIGVGAFQGECRGLEQQLLMHGYVFGENPRTPRILELNLTSQR